MDNIQLRICWQAYQRGGTRSLCWPTTRPAPSLRPKNFTRGSTTQSLHQDTGHQEGLPAIEEAILAGVPINVTLLFSRAQYVVAAKAYLRGIERRITAGLNPAISSVASMLISRGDVAARAKAPDALRDQLGIAVAGQTYEAHRFLVDSPPWQRIFNAGAHAQRLLGGSTGTKDPEASAILYIHALAAPFTVSTMPEATLKAFADHGDRQGRH